MSYANSDGNYMLTEEEEKPNQNVVVVKKPCYGMLYSIAHFIISLFAVYLSWRCNNGFNVLSFLVALFCPYLYILYALATRGGCGVFDNMSRSMVPKV